MLKTLIKNEFTKFARRGMRNKKKNIGNASFFVLMGVLGVSFMFMFGCMFFVMTPSLISNGYGWLSMTYAVILAVAFSVIGSVFMAQSMLYRAKDNDLMMSLPIPSWQILFCRMLPLYVQNLYFCAVVLLPAYVAYAAFADVNVFSGIFFILGLLAVPLLALALCCLLGFVVAFIATRLKHSNIVAVVVSLLLMGAYFAVYSQYMQIVNLLIENGGAIASGMQSFAYPLYLAGRMFEGDFLGALVTLAICCGFFGLVYLLLSKTYIGLITRSHATVKNVYREKRQKLVSPMRALIRKESRLFFRSTAYLLNCGLGVVMLFAGTLFLAIGGRWFVGLIEENFSELTGYLPVAVCAIIFFMSSMDCITAPSVSLEGKSLSVLQSLPVEPWKPLYAKVFFHVIFNAPIAVIAGVVGAIVLRASALATIALVLIPVAGNFLNAGLGILFNLKKPMLEWDNETVVIKQSTSVLFQMLSVFATFILLVVLFFVFNIFLSADVCLIIWLVVLSAGVAGVMAWIKKRGAKLFEEL